MPRPIEALIHTDALAHNLARARQAAPDSRVWAVVKANAYGHGIERAFAGLRGADGFALLDLDEAERLRALGWRGPILLLEGCFEPRDLELCSRLDLWHVVHRDAQIDWLAAHKTQAPHRVFLKMNSGMNRLGFTPEAYRSAWARLNALPQVDEISLMTHFADADGRGRGIADAAGRLRSRHPRPARRAQLSNSAATLRHAATAGVAADWVRAGILLYGSAPDHPQHDIAHWQLAPGDDAALAADRRAGAAARRPRRLRQQLRGRRADAHRRRGLRLCRRLPAAVPHRHAGAGGRRAHAHRRPGVDGHDRRRPGAGAGRRARAARSRCGARARRARRLPIDEVARAAGTIGYELMCALAQRVPVRVVESTAHAHAEEATWASSERSSSA